MSIPSSTRPSARATGEWKPYPLEPFPRAAVETELLRRYPHLAPGHPENPSTRFYEQRAQAEGAEVAERRQALLL